MAKINYLDNNLNIEGKRVLLRVDFNVPTNNGSVSETSRIKKVLPTINFLIEKNAKIIIISHIGRPKGKIVPDLSLKPIAQKLSSLINKNVIFLSESIGFNVIEKSKKISNGEILLLENLRFNKEEELNEKSFAKDLSKIGDIYVNEAFSCSHRAHASVSEITKHIKSFAGKQLTEEVNSIKMITDDAKKPVSCIIGGSKISTKIGVLSNLIKKMENIVIVGAMANEGTTLYAGTPLREYGELVSMLSDQHGDRTDALLTAYEADIDKSTKWGAQAIQADRSFVWEMRTWARAVEAHGNDAYLYFFRHAPPVFRIYVPERAAIDMPDGPTGYGAYHSGDLAYAFGNTRVVGVGWTDWDHEISETMSEFWVNFAKTGNPNGDGLPTWPRYEAATDPWLEFGSEIRVNHDIRKEKLDLFE